MQRPQRSEDHRGGHRRAVRVDQRREARGSSSVEHSQRPAPAGQLAGDGGVGHRGPFAASKALHRTCRPWLRRGAWDCFVEFVEHLTDARVTDQITDTRSDGEVFDVAIRPTISAVSARWISEDERDGHHVVEPIGQTRPPLALPASLTVLLSAWAVQLARPLKNHPSA
jgi:hypothetical protein